MPYLVKSSKALKLSLALLTLFVAFCSAPNFQEITHLLLVHEQGIAHAHEHVHKEHIYIHDHHDEDLPNSEHSHTHQFASLLESSPTLLTYSKVQPFALFKLYRVLSHVEATLQQNSSVIRWNFQNRAPPLSKSLQQFLSAHPTHAPPLV
ncbi:MAG: hypothetical protein H7A32_04590 [Deltaproteobacteria bacterium]|nr:hypothetical protein [Deltaproteobacteria bacterium]